MENLVNEIKAFPSMAICQDNLVISIKVIQDGYVMSCQVRLSYGRNVLHMLYTYTAQAWCDSYEIFSLTLFTLLFICFIANV